MGRLGRTYLDHDGDKSTVSFEGIDMTAGNFDAQVTEQNALITALDAVTLGTPVQTVRNAVVVDVVAAPPVNPFAQTNIRWVIEYTNDTSGRKYTTSVPTADLSLADAMYNGAPALSIEVGGAGEALKDAFEAYTLQEGDPVTVTGIFYRE